MNATQLEDQSTRIGRLEARVEQLYGLLERAGLIAATEDDGDFEPLCDVTEDGTVDAANALRVLTLWSRDEAQDTDTVNRFVRTVCRFRNVVGIHALSAADTSFLQPTQDRNRTLGLLLLFVTALREGMMVESVLEDLLQLEVPGHIIRRCMQQSQQPQPRPTAWAAVPEVPPEEPERFRNMSFEEDL